MAYSLEEMEEYLRKMYERAGEDLMYKAGQYMLDFKRLEEGHKKDVQSGKWTQDEFDTWRKNKLLYGMHWTRMIQTVQRDMAKVNQTALDYINGKIPQIFAQTYNEVAEKVPKSPVSGYSFELVNADTVKNLIHEEGIILPPKKNLDKQKDKLWNAKQVNAQLLQGILQGESIKKIAARMQNVANADLVGATRTARTMCTAAENSGRQSAYNRAAEDGIKFTKTWIAALQGNTRDTHKYLNQQTQPHDKPFESSSGAVLMFPGDWHAPPAEVYNCRCTMITNFKGFDKVKLKEAVERQQEEVEETTSNNMQGVVDNLMDAYGSNEDGRFFVERMQEALNASDDRYTELYNYYIANTQFTSDGDGNYFDPYSKIINIDLRNIDDYTHESVMHEVGHRILDDNVDIWDRYRERISKAIESDAETLMKAVVEEYCPEYADKWHKGKYGYYFDSYNELRDRMQPDYDTAEQVLNGALFAFLKDKNKELVNNLSDDDIDSAMSFFRFSDAVDGLTDGHFSKVSFYGGHGEQYYWGNEENITHEFFANNIALETLNRKGVLELMQKYSPEMRSIYSDMLSEIMESRKE